MSNASIDYIGRYRKSISIKRVVNLADLHEIYINLYKYILSITDYYIFL